MFKYHVEKVFSAILNEHPLFSHLDDEPEDTLSYYFQNPDGGQLLFIDVPKNWEGDLFVDEGMALGYMDWFDNLYFETQTIYKKNKETMKKLNEKWKQHIDKNRMVLLLFENEEHKQVLKEMKISYDKGNNEILGKYENWEVVLVLNHSEEVVHWNLDDNTGKDPFGFQHSYRKDTDKGMYRFFKEFMNICKREEQYK